MLIKRSDRGKTHIVIPDSHADPQHNLNRYEWLGRMIRDVQPDVIVNIGDHWDMPSLSSYDKGKKSFEGRRYKADIKAGITANDILANEGGAGWRNAEKIFCVGNHEQRIERVAENSAEFEGLVSLNDLQLDKYYDRVGGFLDPVLVDGVYYSHYFTSGVMGRSISGEHPAYQLTQKKHASCTQGHSHLLDFCIRHNPKGQRILGCTVGCYFDYHADYAGPANQMYWRGIVLKQNVIRGDYNPYFMEMAEVKRVYG